MALSRESVAIRVAWISVFSNIVLTVGKTLFGVLSHSEALFADGIHSAADVFASAIVLFVIRFASQPADDEHPYGHGKAEVVVSGLVGLILLIVALYIVVESITGFFSAFASPGYIALVAALISFFAKEILYRTSMETAKKYNSKAIEAVALDHKADILASFAAALGILLSMLGDKLEIDFLRYGDRIASIFVAYLIYKLAKKMLIESFNILLDRNIAQEKIDEFTKTIRTFDEVKRIDSIRAREHGHHVFIDLRVSIMNYRTIKQGHDLAREIKNTLMRQDPSIQEVLIHFNPYFAPDEVE